MMGALNLSWIDSVGMLVWMLLLWGGLAWLLISLFGTDHDTQDEPTPTSATTLDDRFARGDLDEDEWRTKRALLGAHPTTPTTRFTTNTGA